MVAVAVAGAVVVAVTVAIAVVMSEVVVVRKRDLSQNIIYSFSRNLGRLCEHACDYQHSCWPTLPVFPGKSWEIITTPRVPGISIKLPEKSQFCLIQDFPEKSMDSPRIFRFFSKI